MLPCVVESAANGCRRSVVRQSSEVSALFFACQRAFLRGKASYPSRLGPFRPFRSCRRPVPCHQGSWWCLRPGRGGSLGRPSIYRRWPDTSTLLGDALKDIQAEWRKIDSLPQLTAELSTELGRSMVTLTLTAGLLLPLQSAVKLTTETLETLLVRLTGEKVCPPEQRLGRLIARQLFWNSAPPL